MTAAGIQIGQRGQDQQAQYEQAEEFYTPRALSRLHICLGGVRNIS